MAAAAALNPAEIRNAIHALQNLLPQNEQPAAPAAQPIDGALAGKAVVDFLVGGLSFLSGLAQKIQRLIPALLGLISSIVESVNKLSDFVKDATTGWKDAKNPDAVPQEQITDLALGLAKLAGVKGNARAQ